MKIKNSVVTIIENYLAQQNKHGLQSYKMPSHHGREYHAKMLVKEYMRQLHQNY